MAYSWGVKKKCTRPTIITIASLQRNMGVSSTMSFFFSFFSHFPFSSIAPTESTSSCTTCRWDVQILYLIGAAVIIFFHLYADILGLIPQFLHNIARSILFSPILLFFYGSSFILLHIVLLLLRPDGGNRIKKKTIYSSYSV